MIDKLTKEQEEKLVEYRDKWLKIGLSTDRVSLAVGKEISDYYYAKLLKKPIVPVLAVLWHLTSYSRLVLYLLWSRQYY